MLALPHSLELQLDFLPITNNTMKVSPFLGLLPTAALAQQLSSVAFFAKEKAELLDFVSLNNDIDYGCHPVVMPAGGEHKLHALLSDVQLDHFKRSLGMTTTMRVEALDHINKRQAATAPIGQGDPSRAVKSPPAAWAPGSPTSTLHSRPQASSTSMRSIPR